MIPNTPKNAIVINNVPAVTILAGRSVTFYGSLLSDKTARNFIINSLKNNIRVFSSAPYNCLDIPQECEEMLKYFVFEPTKDKIKNPYNIQFAEIKLIKE